MTIGEWVASTGTIDDREQRVAGINGYIRREYRHQKTGYKVTMTILNGRSGPMKRASAGQHAFEGVGYTLVSGPTVVTITGGQANPPRSTVPLFVMVRVFRLRRCVHSGAGVSTDTGMHRQILDDYRGQPGLFKIYVTDQSPSWQLGCATGQSFLDELLSVIRHSLGGTDSLRRIPGSPNQVLGNSDHRQSAETAVPGKVAERQ